MRTLAIALGAILSLTSCTSLSQEDYDRLGQIAVEVKQVYEQSTAMVAEARELIAASQERDLTPEERIRVGVLFERVNDLVAQGKRLTEEATEIREKAAKGEFDWDALLTAGLTVLGALGIVRVQRGPAKPTDPATATELRHMDASTLARLKELARQSGGAA